ERSGDVSPPLGETESSLRLDLPGAGEERQHRQLPAAAELAGERASGRVAALQAAVAIRRHEREGVGVRTRHDVHDELGENRNQIAPTPILPRTDEPLRAGVVDHRGACSREAEAAARALGTALHWPRAGRPAPVAE